MQWRARVHINWTITLFAIAQALQIGLLLRLASRLRGAERTNERLSHFAEALALLTDTAEAGFAQMAGALDAPSRRTTRASTSKRIASAVKKGRSIAQVAAAEALSESEIRLHLEMTSVGAKEGSDGAVRV
jgi:hypothetical protein